MEGNMTAVREYMVYGVDDGHKHLWPIHYHLIKNDYLAAIDSIKRGANPLLQDCNGTSAIGLCYQLFFKTINRCLNSTLPLSNRVDKNVPMTASNPPRRRQEHVHVPELHGMADYNAVADESKEEENSPSTHTFTSYVEYVIVKSRVAPSATIQNGLVRRAKGLLAVIRTITEREGYLTACKDAFLRHTYLLEYPALYASLMEFCYLNSRVYTKQRLNTGDVQEAKTLWNTVALMDANIRSITEFITQVAAVIEDLLGIFHVDIYSQSLGNHLRRYPGHDRKLELPGLCGSTVEMFAHLAFVSNRVLLFDVMVLQDNFLESQSTFRWNELLSHLLGEPERLKPFREPLMRSNLRSNVERRLGTSSVVSKATVF